MLKLKKILGLAGLLVSAVFSNSSSATILTSNLNVDNGYSIYISTEDGQIGTLFGSGENWVSTFIDSTSLLSGIDYYLQIFAYDSSGLAGVLGEFTLSGTDHQFANGTQRLLTGDSSLQLNTVGFEYPYYSATDYGQNGVAEPWFGFASIPGVSGDARWIWSSNQTDDNFIFLSTKIFAVATATVPESSILALLAIGIMGMILARRRGSAK